MRTFLKQMTMGVAVTAALALGGFAAQAADPGQSNPPDTAGVPATQQVQPGTLQSWGSTALPTPAPGQRQQMAERAEQMSKNLLAVTGSVFPGEDAPGTGTSITH